jgi:hypothetical protein
MCVKLASPVRYASNMAELEQIGLTETKQAGNRHYWKKGFHTYLLVHKQFEPGLKGPLVPV